MVGKFKERLGRIWEKCVKLDRSNLVSILFAFGILIAVIRLITVSISLKIYEGLLLLPIIFVGMAVIFWIIKNTDKPNQPFEKK